MAEKSTLSWDEQCEADIIRLNERMRKLQTYEEFVEFEREVDEHGHGLMIVSKRGGWYVFSFIHVYEKGSWKRNTSPHLEKNRNRISYLFSDHVSTGECHVKNLYKYFKVSDRAR
jgi:hypothetical protein